MRTRDHCEPHVHALNEDWEIKVFFGYANNDPCHLKMEIVSGVPRLAQVNAVIDEVDARLSQCRSRWWEIHGGTCLENRRVSISDGVLTWEKPPAGAKVSRARYLANTCSVTFETCGSLSAQTAHCP